MSSFLPRAEYGRPLEPTASVLHGAGQSPDAFLAYCDLLRAQETLPLVYMTYLGIRSSPEGIRKYVQRLEEQVNAHPTLPLMPQIGLSMTTDGTPEQHYEQDVALGRHDEALKVLFGELGEMGRPFFLRIGYECNGPWNGYEPSSYRDAYHRVAGMLRDSGLPAANVWCVEPWEIDRCYEWKPDEDMIDWWSVDWFDPSGITNSEDFLQRAHAAGKPVMIGESSPRRLGTTDPLARWDLWYRPYFESIRSHPGIKSFCYINWNWAQYPMWADWGDSRLEAAEELVALWAEEMRSPLYAHA